MKCEFRRDWKNVDDEDRRSTYSDAGWVVKTKHENVFRIDDKYRSDCKRLLPHGEGVNHAVGFRDGTVAVRDDGELYVDGFFFGAVVGFHILEPFHVILHAVNGQCNDLAPNGLKSLVLLTQAAKFGSANWMKSARMRAQDGPLAFLPFMKGGPVSMSRLAREVRAFVSYTQNCWFEIVKKTKVVKTKHQTEHDHFEFVRLSWQPFALRHATSSSLSSSSSERTICSS
eukprot:scaffold39580_cov244-Amphora_coffeaeformis.AAC.4